MEIMGRDKRHLSRDELKAENKRELIRPGTKEEPREREDYRERKPENTENR